MNSFKVAMVVIALALAAGCGPSTNPANAPHDSAKPGPVPADPRQEADHFLRVARIAAGDIVPVLDIEYSGGRSAQQLRALIGGYRISQAVYVATALGIPDLLAEGPREIRELARASGAHAASLRRVLRALAGVGVLEKVGPDRFALAPLGAALRKGVAGSVRSSVLFLLNESHWRPWGNLLSVKRTGAPASA